MHVVPNEYSTKTYCSDWNPVLKVGAVDCSNQINTPVCRDYEILSTPTLKYFPPHIDKKEVGIAIPRVADQRDTNTMNSTVHDLRNNITLELLMRDDLPQLQQFKGSMRKSWQKRFYNRLFGKYFEYAKPKSQYVVLVVECSPMIGPQLVLDYWSVKKVAVVPIPCKNLLLSKLGFSNRINDAVFVMPLLTTGMRSIPGIYPISHRTIDEEDSEEEGKFTREEALTKLHSYFKKRGIHVPKAFNLSSVKDVTDNLRRAFSETSTGKKPFKHTGEVFQVDIEGALSHSLAMEIPVHKHISGKALTALKNYLQVLYKYFPTGKLGKKYLKCIYKKVQKKDSATAMTGQAFVGYVEQCEDRHDPEYLEPDNGWVGCHGTFPMYRGFPCSMWTMFHTLTVQAYHKKAKDPQEVLRAMKGYISNFFGCSDCTRHFMKMAATMEDEVKTLEDSVLYLWAAHNKANKRLHGDATEDPNFPKVQFPTSRVCEACHGEDGEFNKKEVLKFLHHMYTNVNKIVTPTQLGFNTTYSQPKKYWEI